MATHLAVQRELVIGKKLIGFIKEEISSDEFLEPPILPLDKAIRPLNLCTHMTGKDHGAVTTRAHTNIHTCTYIQTCMYTYTHTHTHTGKEWGRGGDGMGDRGKVWSGVGKRNGKTNGVP